MPVDSPYPEQIANESNLRDLIEYVDTASAEHVNLQRAFIRDITAALGTNPQAGCPTLADRLNVSIDDNGILKSPGQIVRVAKFLGDFTSIQAAIDSITDADASKPYLIDLFPGIYDEPVSLKNCVNIIARDPDRTEIRQTVTFTTDNESFCYVAVPISVTNGIGLICNAVDTILHITCPITSWNNHAVQIDDGDLYISAKIRSGSTSAILGNSGTLYLKQAELQSTGNNANSHAVENLGCNIKAAFSVLDCQHADAWSIYASVARHVTLYGCYANRPLHANVTNTVSGGLVVDPEIQVIS